MNISDLKKILLALPDEVTPVQFAAIEAEVEDVLAQQRQVDEAELVAHEQAAAKLREKLGVKAALPPAVRPEPTPRRTGDTDADNGVNYDEDADSAQSFQAELASLRAANVQRRRSRGH